MLLSKAAVDTLEKVSGEFESEILTELQEGRSDSMAQIQAMKRDAAEAATKVLENGARQAESLKRQMIGGAELETRNAQLRSMEEAVTKVFDAALEKISQTSGSRHEKSLVRLIEEGVEVIGPKAKVSCSAKDRKEVVSAMRKVNGDGVKLVLDEKDIDSIGGVTLTSNNGSVKFDNTIEARLERMKADLRREIAGIMAGG